MSNFKIMSDDAALEMLGKRLGRRRLDLNLTQARLAEQAGVSKKTIERIETGASVQSLNLIRILRALDLLQGINLMVPEPLPSPMELLKLKGKSRRRASSKPAENQPKKNWSWGDDS